MCYWVACLFCFLFVPFSNTVVVVVAAFIILYLNNNKFFGCSFFYKFFFSSTHFWLLGFVFKHLILVIHFYVVAERKTIQAATIAIKNIKVCFKTKHTSVFAYSKHIATHTHTLFYSVTHIQLLA